MCPWFNISIGTHAWMPKTGGLEICFFLTCPINFREKRFWMNFLWLYLFETGTDRAEILHSCQTRGTEQLLPWSKRGLPLKKSEIPWFAVVLSARARPSRAGGLKPLPRKGTGDLPDGARAFIFDRSFFRNWPVQVIRRFFILLEIEYVNATEGKSKELKYFFIWPIFCPSSLTIYNDEMGPFWSNLVRWIEHFSALDSAFPAFWRCKIWKNESTWQRIMPKFPLKVARPPPWRICQGL